MNPSPSDLPPRIRQVLRSFLEADSDKQARVRLGLSINTTNSYREHIYHYFGVTSRAEPLTRWSKRGWNNRCTWAGE
jgi:DNA-binding CsgD family transcriptional regulator